MVSQVAPPYRQFQEKQPGRLKPNHNCKFCTNYYYFHTWLALTTIDYTKVKLYVNKLLCMTHEPLNDSKTKKRLLGHTLTRRNALA